MTIGQRIAQKRKELGLSQEALGAELGVSRQAIYKWEADAALPEIEKLVTLSKFFGVNVGWLLGAEEAPQQADSGELSENQLRMVREIVDRYLAARKETEAAPSPPEPPKHRRWLWALAAVGCAALLLAGWSLFSRLDALDKRYNDLQMSVGNITYDVNWQVNSIAGRVEQVLKSQNHLAAEYSAELTSLDLAANTAHFSAGAVPKTYTEGMTAVFQADSGGQVLEFPGTLGAGNTFSAEISCPITDSITISVAFVTGDRRETQVLDCFTGLYSRGFPEVFVMGFLRASDAVGEGRALLEEYACIRADNSQALSDNQTAQVRVGLFKDRELVMWYEPCETPARFRGFTYDFHFYHRPAPVTLEEGLYCIAAVVTDRYGRETVFYDAPAVGYDPAAGNLAYSQNTAWSGDPADWSY